MAILRYAATVAACALLITACSRQDSGSRDDAATTSGDMPESPVGDGAPPETTVAAVDPQQKFWTALNSLCGKTYAGNITVGTEESDRAYFEHPLRIHADDCRSDEIVIRFHFGDDDTLAWALARHDGGLSLEHRNTDSAARYGGATSDEGSANTQRFPADADTVTARPSDTETVWYITMLPGEKFVYGFRNEERFRFFELVFDLAQELEPPNGAL